MINRWLKKLALQATETVAAVGLVMLFFLLFIVLLGLSFPHGTSLNELMFQPDDSQSRQYGSGIELEMEDEAEPFIATLAQTRRTVKDRPANGIAWSSSRSGKSLRERHAIQTLSRSQATISFGATEELILQENSLVVIRNLEGRRGDRPRRASVVAVEGEVRGRLSGDDQGELEIVTAHGTARVLEAVSRSDFKVKVNEDETSTFVVFDGAAEVTSGGETVVLEANQVITVRKDQAPGTPQSLPEPPALLVPVDQETLTYSVSPPEVRFAWLGPASSTDYRLVISRDAEFDDPLLEQPLSALEFQHGNLPAGRYYWRVASIVGGTEGHSSPAHRLDMVLDDVPPGLEVAFPRGPVHASAYELHGIAEPGTRLFIKDQSVAVSDSGEFEHTLKLDRGLNVVVVEAVDAAGNITYRSERLNAKY